MTRQKRTALVLLTVTAGIGLALLLWHQIQATPRSSIPPHVVKSLAPAAKAPLVGESILSHYADPTRTPQEDLVWMSRALGNFALLVKGDNPIPLGANEDIANALRGRNYAHLRFLPDQHPAFNDRGQIIDRWGTPLYFHANARDRLDIRSAGPDKVMWTADDIHMRHDGQFLQGEDLLSQSLFDGVKTHP